jgi:transcriptional regulator with XRE-family HTH domain
MTYSTHLLRHLRFTIGQNIHRLRAKQELPLGKLSQLTDISRDLLEYYEIGKGDIQLRELLKIACFFGVEVQELMG